MLDPLQAQPAFGEQLARPAPAAGAGVTVRLRIDYALAIVMARRGMVADLAKRVAVWDIVLPSSPTRNAQGSRALLGIGPGRWLAMLDNGATDGQGGNLWVSSLVRDLAGCASVTNQSDGYSVLSVGGPKARAMLAKGVAIDLHPRAFCPGDVAVTQIAHIGVMLWQIDDQPTYEIAVSRSLFGSFCHWLAASAEQFGLAVEVAS